MYIIVVGAGSVGGELARRLAANKQDVVVIEKDRDACNKVHVETGVIAIHGSAVDVESLKAAGIDKADTLVAATGADADNLACAMLGKSFGVDQIIVRMRNSEYEKAYRLAGVTSVIRVTDLLINQMIMDIEKPVVKRLMTVGEGKADICSVVITLGARVAGLTVEEIAKDRRFPPQCVFVAILKSDQRDNICIPRGKQVIQEGDEIIFISTAEDMKKAAEFLTAKK